MKSLTTPEGMRKMLTPDKMHQAALNRLQNYADAQETQVAKKSIEIYSESSLPYCLPQFLPIDRANPTHRYDDMVGGFPYTSKSYPWPTCELGEHKQPIVQIDLERAGELLGENLESGLLQVWANVRAEGWKMSEGWPFGNGLNEIQTRVIPKSALTEPPDTFCPLNAPWDIPDEQLDMSTFHACLMRLENDHIQNPRINWINYGRMFLPTYRYDYHCPDQSGDFVEAFFDDRFPHEYVPNPEATFIPRGTYLGGFGGGHGGQNEPFPLKFSDGTEGKLLFNTVSDGDSYSSVTLAVLFKRNVNEEIQFETIFYHYA